MAIKPVVFIPGFPASELKLRATGEIFFPPPLGDFLSGEKKQRLIRLLTGPDDPPGSVEAGEPIRVVLEIAKQAQTLYDILQDPEFGYSTQAGSPNFTPIGWDWRKAVDTDQVLDDVTAAIDDLSGRNGGAPVVAILHSTGGLVFRRCLELRPELAAKVEQIFSLGIPWAGTLASFGFINTGAAFGPIPPFQLTAQEVQGIMSHAQAAYDLLPPDPAKTDMTGADGKRLNLFIDEAGAQRGPNVLLDWIGDDPARAYMKEFAGDADRRLGRRTSEIILPGGAATPPITNVGGWGLSTETRSVDDAGTLSFASTDEGDGTIQLVSAQWLRGGRVRTFVLPIGVYPVGLIPMPHSQIWNSPPMRQLFGEVLRGDEPGPFICAAVDGNDAVNTAGPSALIRLVAADAQGRPLPGARATFQRLAQPFSVDLGGALKAAITVPRAFFHGNVRQDLCQFQIDLAWDGAPEPRPIQMLINV